MTQQAEPAGGPASEPAPPLDPRFARHETAAERMDRNWDELVAELRVTQTGAQILVGFLLTVPFQQRFADLDRYQRWLYLVLVGLAVLATALIVAPVSMHRMLFRRRLKRELVDSSSALARAGLAVLALVLTGVPGLLFDVVVSRVAGIVAMALVLTLLVVCWWAIPRLVERRARLARKPVPGGRSIPSSERGRP